MTEPGEPLEPMELLERSDISLLDTVDHLLNKGLVLTGEVVIGLAGVDLIYLRLSVLLCAADRILPKAES
ncbi:MAG TPA: gas vesicle protein [Thermoanaerobaculia bacterium]|jgi:hypothetical protein